MIPHDSHVTTLSFISFFFRKSLHFKLPSVGNVDDVPRGRAANGDGGGNDADGRGLHLVVHVFQEEGRRPTQEAMPGVRKTVDKC